MISNRWVAKNAVFSAGATILKVCLQIALIPIMARLLGPSEYGLYGLALPIVFFFGTLADGGLGASLAREPETSTDVWSTAFWVILILCAGIAVIVTGVGYVLAYVIDVPRLGGLLALLSISFLFVGLAVVPDARLVRRGNLTFHTTADLFGSLFGAAVGIWMASSGMGVWSLAGQYVTSFGVRSMVLNVGAFVVPTGKFRLSLIRTHLLTGRALVGGKLAELLGRFLENLVFGRIFGPAPLGAYSLASQTSRFLCEAAVATLWGSLYSQALHAHHRDIARLHANLSRFLATALFPVAMVLSASAPTVFSIFLGPKWDDAAPIFQAILPLYAVACIGNLSGAILLAGGKNVALLWSTVGLALARVLVVCSGWWTGQIVVALGTGVVFLVFSGIITFVAARDESGGASIGKLLSALRAPFVAAASGGLITHVIASYLDRGLYEMVISVACGCFVYGIVLFLIEGKRLMSDLAAIGRALPRPTLK